MKLNPIIILFLLLLSQTGCTDYSKDPQVAKAITLTTKILFKSDSVNQMASSDTSAKGRAELNLLLSDPNLLEVRTGLYGNYKSGFTYMLKTSDALSKGFATNKISNFEFLNTMLAYKNVKFLVEVEDLKLVSSKESFKVLKISLLSLSNPKGEQLPFEVTYLLQN